MLMHAEWGGRGVVEGARVLDVFAGTGALGLEALSRGAAVACFIEQDAAALRALRANVAACKAGDQAVVLGQDVFAFARANGAWPTGIGLAEFAEPSRLSLAPGGRGEPSRTAIYAKPASLVFLDPPYGQSLVQRALDALRETGSIATDALVVAETGRDETWVPEQALLAEREYGAARILVFRAA